MNSDDVFTQSCSLSLAYIKVGVKCMRSQKLPMAKKYLLRAKQYIEPAGSGHGWHKFEVWYYQKINVAINLVILYRKMKELGSAIELIKSLISEVESSEFLQEII